jgi:hypothetical protein
MRGGHLAGDAEPDRGRASSPAPRSTAATARAGGSFSSRRSRSSSPFWPWTSCTSLVTCEFSQSSLLPCLSISCLCLCSNLFLGLPCCSTNAFYARAGSCRREPTEGWRRSLLRLKWPYDASTHRGETRARLEERRGDM